MLSIFTVYNDDQQHIYEAWGWVWKVGKSNCLPHKGKGSKIKKCNEMV